MSDGMEKLEKEIKEENASMQTQWTIEHLKRDENKPFPNKNMETMYHNYVKAMDKYFRKAWWIMMFASLAWFLLLIAALIYVLATKSSSTPACFIAIAADIISIRYILKRMMVGRYFVQARKEMTFLGYTESETRDIMMAIMKSQCINNDTGRN